MAYGFDFSGLYRRFGELNVSNWTIREANRIVNQYGPEGYAIRLINSLRRRYTLGSQQEAAALFRDVRDNIDAAQRYVANPDDVMPDEDLFPYSPNVLGDEDGDESYVYSGYVEIVDEFGDSVRKVPFLVESESRLSEEDLYNRVGNDANEFIEKYEREIAEQLGIGKLKPGGITVSFIARR